MPTEDVKSSEIEITDVTADSRQAGKGSLYVAVRGIRTDDETYIRHITDAIDGGAAAVAAERIGVTDTIRVPIVTFENGREAASRIFAAWYADRIGTHPRLVAVTGTNGKTTVAHMTAHILSTAGYRVGVIGTLGACMGDKLYAESPAASSMTTPPPEDFYRIIAEMASDNADFIVFEASSQGIAQERLAGLHVSGLELSAAVFTNLSPEHMDFHPTMEDYFAVKKRLFTEFSPTNRIINTSDEYGARLLAETNSSGDANAIAIAVDSSLCAQNVEFHGICGVSFLYSSPTETFPVSIPSPGRYAVENGVMAISCALALGICKDDIVRAMSSFYGVRGRMERVAADILPFPVFIDYAHTPAALEGLLSTIRDTEPGRRLTVVFGCGGDRDRTKRPVMGNIATRFSDLAIITSDNRRTERAADIINDIVAGVTEGVEYVVIPDREKAITFAVMTATENDVLVLAGKGHETYDIVGAEKHHFDEREIVLAAAEKRRCVGG